MAWYQLDPRLPWIWLQGGAEGGAQIHDQRTGETYFCPDEDCVYGFAADHSAQGGPGLGNLVHSVLGALGFTRCKPCAKRQLELNVASNRVWTPFG